MHREQTFLAIKPEAIQRRHIGEIVSRFEKKGLKLVAMKLACPSIEMVEKHYPADEAWLKSSGDRSYQNYVDKGIDPGMTPREIALRTRKWLLEYLTDRPVLAMVWEGPHAVKACRQMAGHTNPLAADLGTVRGDLSPDSYEMSDNFDRSIFNLLHASGSVDEAKYEINLWFKPAEVLDYDMVDQELMISNNWGKVRRSKPASK